MTNDTDKVLSKKELENTKILNRNIAMKQRLFS